MTNLCKSFDQDVVLDYVGVVKPSINFMKPHFDKNDVHGEDILSLKSAMLYLNDDFEGGSTVFEHMDVKPRQVNLSYFQIQSIFTM